VVLSVPNGKRLEDRVAQDGLSDLGGFFWENAGRDGICCLPACGTVFVSSLGKLGMLTVKSCNKFVINVLKVDLERSWVLELRRWDLRSALQSEIWWFRRTLFGS
jgi:hypothetical protein